MPGTKSSKKGSPQRRKDRGEENKIAALCGLRGEIIFLIPRIGSSRPNNEKPWPAGGESSRFWPTMA